MQDQDHNTSLTQIYERQAFTIEKISKIESRLDQIVTTYNSLKCGEHAVKIGYMEATLKTYKAIFISVFTAVVATIVIGTIKLL